MSSELQDIHYANGLWVAVGWDITRDLIGIDILDTDPSITTSATGTAWAEQTSNVSGLFTGLNAIHYANGLWVAVGGGGTIITAP